MQSPAHTLRLIISIGAMLGACLAQAGTVDWPKVEAPPDVAFNLAGQQFSMNGLPMRVQVFATKKSATDIADFYKKEWGARHVENQVKNATVIGRMDGDFYTTVQLTSTGNLTKGVVAVTHLKAIESLRSQDQFQAPFNSKVLSDMQSVDGGKISRHTVFTNRQSTADNRDRLVSMMKEQGMALEVEGKPDGKRQQALFFRGANQEAIAAITQADNQTAVVLNVVGTLRTSQ